MTAILKVDEIQDTAGNLIIKEDSNTITLGASGDTITIPSGATIDLSNATQTGVGGVIAAKIETIAPTTPDVTTTSTTYAEVASGLRITHALSNSSNKLIFMFSSTDMYTAGCNGQVAVGSTSDVTTSLIGNQMMLVKRNGYGGGGTIEVDTMMGMAEYAPGSTSSVTYTPIFARTSAASGTFYINNSVTVSRMTFTLMEIA